MSDLITLREPDGPFTDAQQMTATAGTALLAARRLKEYANSDDDAMSRTAASMLSTLIGEVGLAATHSAFGGPIDNRFLRAGLRLEEHVSGPSLPERDVPSGLQRWVARWWTSIGAVLSLGVAGLLMSGAYALAALLLLLRVTESAAVDLPPRHASGASARRQHAIAFWSVARCLAGHACDAVLLLAVGYTFVAANRPVWGWAASAVAAFMLFATVVRLSALQFGLPLRRLALERVARNGTLLFGLTLAAVWAALGHDPASGSVPVLALPLVGVSAYAIVEMLRVHWRVRVLNAARRSQDPDATPERKRVLMVDVNGSVRTTHAVV